ncbi:hypothetical protein TrRE_jg12466 [Triparma retinervis]|uniref:FHA domain-containing protein n=1 Tax=Triparma retinervis TaxID=2557542 RepID=A0A9W7KSZ7_9STRA|nr:hypothetical protein TrRE_jg12466 [Triparma retinervis]
MDMDENGTPGAISSKVELRSGDKVKYKTYWASLNGTRIFLYKTEKSKKPSRKLWISYWEEEKFDTNYLTDFGKEHPENLADLENVMAHKRGYRCFATEGLFSLKFETPELGGSWNKLIKFGYVKALLGSDGDDGDENDEWSESWFRLYFILLPGHVYAYEKSSDPHPKQHLCINKIGVERSEEDPRILKVATPLRNLKVKFRDEYQMFDWLHGLMRASKESNCGLLLAKMHAELNKTLMSLLSEKAPLSDEDLVVQVHVANDIDWSGKKASKRTFPLKKGGSVVIGRDESVGIFLDDPNISRAHCKIDVDARGGCRIADLGSGNGTKVNLKLIEPHASVTAGDVLVVGKSTILSVGKAVDKGKVEEAVAYRKKRQMEKSQRSKTVDLV